MNIPVLRAARQEAEQCFSSQHAEHGPSIAIANEIRPARHRLLGRAPGARPDLTKQIINRLITGLRRTEILAQRTMSGYQAIDDLLGQIGSRARGTTEEAVARGSDLVRNGNRGTMLSVLGTATLFGFLLRAARSTGIFIPHSDLRDCPADRICHNGAAAS